MNPAQNKQYPSSPSRAPELQSSFTSPEQADVEVIPSTLEISPELEDHIQAVQKGEIELPGPIEVGTHEGQPLSIQPSAPSSLKITLPLTRDEFLAAKKSQKPTQNALTWLITFIEWIIKKNPHHTTYRQPSPPA